MRNTFYKLLVIMLLILAIAIPATQSSSSSAAAFAVQRKKQVEISDEESEELDENDVDEENEEISTPKASSKSKSKQVVNNGNSVKASSSSDTFDKPQKKRKSHDMSVEKGKHGKSHNLMNDAFFFVPPEATEPSGANDGLFHTKNSGIAKELKGRICVFTFFVSTKNWVNDDYHDLYKKNLKLAEDWLTKQAKKYGSTISFENRYPLGDTSIYIPTITSYSTTGNPRKMFENAINSMEITEEQLNNIILTETDCDNCVVNFIIDSPGRSFCYLSYQGAPKSYFADFTWTYRSTTNNTPEQPGTVAHEMLHAFGAFDMYERDGYDPAKSRRCKQNYPMEIMYTGRYDLIDQLVMSPATAYMIGIGKKPSDLKSYLPDEWAED